MYDPTETLFILLPALQIYRNPHLQTMLRAYTARMRNASLLVPIGGITCLANLAALSGGRVLMLAGDKAYNHEVCDCMARASARVL